MDKNNWVRDGWQLISEYQLLGEAERSIASRMVSFALERQFVTSNIVGKGVEESGG